MLSNDYLTSGTTFNLPNFVPIEALKDLCTIVANNMSGFDGLPHIHI
jgi:hypothetical protein